MVDNPGMIKDAVAGAQAPPMQLPPQGAPAQMPPLGAPAGMPPLGDDTDSANTLPSIDRRLRVLEERFSNLRRRSQVSEQNALKSSKEVRGEIQNALAEIKELRMEIHDMKEKFKLLINELRGYATKEEFKVLEKYVNMWEPVTFVSRNEVDKLIKDSVEQRFADLNVRIQQEKFIEQLVERTFARSKTK